MPTIDVTPEEHESILKARLEMKHHLGVAHGMFLAVEHLSNLGDQSAGGAGKEPNPLDSGKPYGYNWYLAADSIATLRQEYIKKHIHKG